MLYREPRTPERVHTQGRTSQRDGRHMTPHTERRERISERSANVPPPPQPFPRFEASPAHPPPQNPNPDPFQQQQHPVSPESLADAFSHIRN